MITEQIEKISISKELELILKKYYENYMKIRSAPEVVDERIQKNLELTNSEIEIYDYVKKCIYRSYLPKPIYDFYQARKKAPCAKCYIYSLETNWELECLQILYYKKYTAISLAKFCEERFKLKKLATS